MHFLGEASRSRTASPVLGIVGGEIAPHTDLSASGGIISKTGTRQLPGTQQGTFMPKLSRFALLSFAVVSTFASGQAVTVLRDLDAQGRVTLTKDELSQLLPSASMSRVSPRGNTQRWKNDSDGSFVISSDNKATTGRNSTAQGKWHISDDGRYCVLIEWKGVETEQWCRYIVKSGGAYYGSKSDRVGTEKVYKLDISK